MCSQHSCDFRWEAYQEVSVRLEVSIKDGDVVILRQTFKALQNRAYIRMDLLKGSHGSRTW